MKESQFVASIIEFVVSILNIIFTIIYYAKQFRSKQNLTLIGLCHILFGVVLLTNQIITMYMVDKGIVEVCALWNLQGFTKNFSEAIIDWIFTLRVMYLEVRWKYLWVFMFVLLDAGPRIVGQFFYVTRMYNGACLFSESPTEAVTKTVMNTVYIGIVAIYFAVNIFTIVRQVKSQGAERLESLAFTSTVFALILCLVRTVIYIPFILNTWPSITGVLIPIEFIILPPLCFLNILYGSKLKINFIRKSNSLSNMTTKDVGQINT